MENFNKRAYKRDTEIQTEAKISLDGKVWHRAEVFDISAGGLKFLTNIIFDIGEDIWFDLEVPEFEASRELKVIGTIRRIEPDEKNFHVYGVSFNDLSESQSISIDENILMRERKNKYFKG